MNFTGFMIVMSALICFVLHKVYNMQKEMVIIMDGQVLRVVYMLSIKMLFVCIAIHSMQYGEKFLHIMAFKYLICAEMIICEIIFYMEVRFRIFEK